MNKYSEKLDLFKRSKQSIWTDPYISKNLVSAHLNDSNDAASRNHLAVDKTIAWIDENIKKNSSLIDLGCGPGIYSAKLAKLGHNVHGIDCNRESIKYAKKNNDIKGCTSYEFGNYLIKPINNIFHAALMVYCDFGALIPSEQTLLLQKLRKCLSNDGLFVFDVFGEELVKKKTEIKTWSIASGKDFWSEDPYFHLSETIHFQKVKAMATRHLIINQITGKCKEFIMWDQYYSVNDIKKLLDDNGFNLISVEKKLITSSDFVSNDVMFVIAQKK